MHNRNFRPKEKTASGAIRHGFYEKHSNLQDSKLNGFNYFTGNSTFPQCKKCGSDCGFHKYESKDGLCRTCEQRAEYIYREFPKYRKSSQIEVTR